jgi:hypothetical protein
MSRTNRDTEGYRPFYLVSGARDDRTARENLERHVELGELLRDNYGWGVKEVEGCYKGMRELSYLVTVPEPTLVVHVVARLFNQETLILVDEDNQATLIGLDFVSEESLGTFQRITEAEAKASGNWTRDGNQYWGCK